MISCLFTWGLYQSRTGACKKKHYLEYILLVVETTARNQEVSDGKQLATGQYPAQVMLKNLGEKVSTEINEDFYK